MSCRIAIPRCLRTYRNVLPTVSASPIFSGRARTFGLIVLAGSLCFTACSLQSGDAAKSGAGNSSPSAGTAATIPSPGAWTLPDLQPGRIVPTDDIKRLFPDESAPTPPKTLTTNTKQGAIDAAVYFDKMVDLALNTRNPEYLAKIDGQLCTNCSSFKEIAASKENSRVYSTPVKLLKQSAAIDPAGQAQYQVNLKRENLVIIDRNETTGELELVDRNLDTSVNYLVQFHEGNWTPIYLKVDRIEW